MGLSIVKMQDNSICQHSSVFTANSRFRILFKHSTIVCTFDCLSMLLLVLEDGKNFLVLSNDLWFHSVL